MMFKLPPYRERPPRPWLLWSEEWIALFLLVSAAEIVWLVLR